MLPEPDHICFVIWQYCLSH